jgi:hypothetical protein
MRPKKIIALFLMLAVMASCSKDKKNEEVPVETECVSSDSYTYETVDIPIEGEGFGGLELKYHQNENSELIFVFDVYPGANRFTKIIRGYKIGEEERVNISPKVSTLELIVPVGSGTEFVETIIVFTDPGDTALVVDITHKILPLCEL